MSDRRVNKARENTNCRRRNGGSQRRGKAGEEWKRGERERIQAGPDAQGLLFVERAVG
ncbi:hypothetical protein ACFOEY_14195 [Paracandidimonas soli]|uniref:hypothetical protein n=1 Tax=Paracandidimonas soli TaxID=1917182 RepID=UPI0036071A7E